MAAQAAYVDRFVHSLPEGYDTVLEDEGSNVSAGGWLGRTAGQPGSCDASAASPLVEGIGPSVAVTMGKGAAKARKSRTGQRKGAE